jgi:Ser-tRNA(Ala) deacylase AlaX
MHWGRFLGEGEEVGGEECLLEGRKASMHVSEAFRHECVRLHSAGHLIDVAMNRLGLLSTMTATKGYHFSDGPYVEFKGSTDAVLADLPVQLNEILSELVRADIATVVKTMTRDDAGAMCGCDTSMYPEHVRVVTVGGLSCPCGGTHVKSTQDLGAVTVTKVKKKKDIYKVSYSVPSP